ncbi:MAG: GrpB family protein [Muribaculaceae bacterium]|nr:GrpB family protein [Muribaculaceae bacterium]
MKKPLEQMTLQELWELFPITLISHNEGWRNSACAEITALSRLLHNFNPVINHIGSTAIPDIPAKPVIDLLVEISPDIKWHEIKDIMQKSGYICMSESEHRISFNKGYTPDGYAPEVFHIHFHRTGDCNEIIFRDYLIAHPEDAKAYGTLKRSLLPKFAHDRDAYTEAKSEFIERILAKASKKHRQ